MFKHGTVPPIKTVRHLIMQEHGKSFLMGLVGTVQGRLGWASDESRKIVPEIEAIIRESKWLDSVDFDTIHYVMRFGAEAESKVHCRRNSKYQELEVASQVSMKDLHEVFLDREKLKVFLCVELSRVLTHIEAKYRLPELPKLNSYLGARTNA